MERGWFWTLNRAERDEKWLKFWIVERGTKSPRSLSASLRLRAVKVLAYPREDYHEFEVENIVRRHGCWLDPICPSLRCMLHLCVRHQS